LRGSWGAKKPDTFEMKILANFHPGIVDPTPFRSTFRFSEYEFRFCRS
jgi:hypothetical protein